MATIEVPKKVLDAFGTKKACVDLLREAADLMELASNRQVHIVISTVDSSRRTIALTDHRPHD